MDDAAMAAVALDDGGWIALLVLGVLAAIATARLACRHSPADTAQDALRASGSVADAPCPWRRDVPVDQRQRVGESAPLPNRAKRPSG